MDKKALQAQIQKKKSLLCVGLDTDLEKIPQHLLKLEDPIFEFNKAIIDATHSYAIAYKPNTAFYEAYGIEGWKSLQKTIDYLNTNYPEVFTIADAKRGDIGNTSKRYAQAFLQKMNFNSITVAPYMGSDSVQPFLEYKNKWVILLGLTSNNGAIDFQTSSLQTLMDKQPEMLFEKVLKVSKQWGDAENLMYVIGATKTDYLKKVRAIVPDNFLLVPGVGAQGGDLQSVIKNGMGAEPNLIINASRAVIYADNSVNFAQAAAEKAKTYQREMAAFL